MSKVLAIRGTMPSPGNLRRQRLAHFLLQPELARQSGIHRLTISRLESGRANPATRAVRALAEALGITPGAAERARATLIEANLRLVVSIAKKLPLHAFAAGGHLPGRQHRSDAGC